MKTWRRWIRERVHGCVSKKGTPAAVKELSNDSRKGQQEFFAEVQIITQLRHRNIVELIGYCRDGGKFLLVCVLLPKGCLNKALFRPKFVADVLSWSRRWEIGSGTAAALHCLHEGRRQHEIHREVEQQYVER